MIGPTTPAGGDGRWVNLGEVSVDGARLGIADPVYVPAEKEPLHSDLSGPWANGTGIQFLSGFGDGGYDVWAWVIDAGTDGEVDERIAQVVVTMIDDEDLKWWREQS